MELWPGLAHLLLLTSTLVSRIQSEWSGYRMTPGDLAGKKIELIYIVSGPDLVNKAQRYQKDISKIIAVTTAQINFDNVKAGVLFELSDNYIVQASEMAPIPSTQRNLINYFAEQKLQSPKSITTANAIAYSRKKIFSSPNKDEVDKIVVILFRDDMGIQHIHDYLWETCTHIITFVVVYPKKGRTCGTRSVQRTIKYVNSLLNYTKLLAQNQALCSENVVQTIDFQNAIAQAIHKNEDIISYCKRNPHLKTLDQTVLLRCVGFFCKSNPILWICAILSCAATLLLIFWAVKMYWRFKPAPKEPLDYYSFLAEALAYHNKFVMAQSQCLYDSRIFQPPPPKKKKTLRDRIMESTHISGASTKTNSGTNSPKNKTSGRLYQKATASRRTSLSSGPRTLTTVTPRQSAASSRRASKGASIMASPKITPTQTPMGSAPGSRRASTRVDSATASPKTTPTQTSKPSSRRTSIASVGRKTAPTTPVMRKSAPGMRRKSISSIEAKSRPAATKRMKQTSLEKLLKQHSEDLPNVAVGVTTRRLSLCLQPQSKQQMGGVRRIMKKSRQLSSESRKNSGSTTPTTPERQDITTEVIETSTEKQGVTHEVMGTSPEQNVTVQLVENDLVQENDEEEEKVTKTEPSEDQTVSVSQNIQPTEERIDIDSSSDESIGNDLDSITEGSSENNEEMDRRQSVITMPSPTWYPGLPSKAKGTG